MAEDLGEDLKGPEAGGKDLQPGGVLPTLLLPSSLRVAPTQIPVQFPALSYHFTACVCERAEGSPSLGPPQGLGWGHTKEGTI